MDVPEAGRTTFLCGLEASVSVKYGDLIYLYNCATALEPGTQNSRFGAGFWAAVGSSVTHMYEVQALPSGFARPVR